MDRVNRGAPVWANGEKPERKDVDINVGSNIVVIGGGSVAVDTARTLVRLGVDKVTCVCLEAEDKMPAPLSEIKDAREEGIEFICSASPKKVNCDGGWVTVQSVDFSRVDHIEKDENGKIIPVMAKDGAFNLVCDSVIFAVGQTPDVANIAEGAGLQMSGSRIKSDVDTLETSMEGVFMAGDVVEARGSIIQAMASGRKAALSIDNMLQDRELTTRIAHELHTGPQSQWIYRIHLEDVRPQQIRKLRNRDTFDLVEIGFDEKTAVEETKRCMKCGYEQVDQEKCLGCGVCAVLCPVQAITMVKPEHAEGGSK